MGVFSAVKDARPTQGGRYFDPGNYVVKINRCKHGMTRKNVDFFVVETKILESDNDGLPIGSEASWMVTMDKDAAPGNIKSFAMAATGVDEDGIDEAGILEIVSDRQPLAGMIMRVEAFNKPTKEGKPFTRIKWLEADPETFAKHTPKAAQKIA